MPNEEILEHAARPEQQESTREVAAPEAEQNLTVGAEMLEVPSDGSFMQGLQTFIAWVKALVDDKPKIN